MPASEDKDYSERMGYRAYSDHAHAHYGMAEAITVLGVWLIGLLIIWLAVANYKGDQNVSLENIVGYTVIGMVLTSGAVLFRDLIARWINSLIDKQGSDHEEA